MDEQWEALKQLGPQISKRANIQLRTGNVTDLSTAEALAAIILLDNTAIPDALRLTLEQRTETLSALFDSARAPQHPLNTGAMIETPILASARFHNLQTSTDRQEENVVAKATEALNLIIATHSHIRNIFVGQSETCDEPLLLHLMNLLLQPPRSISASPNSPPAVAPGFLSTSHPSLPSIFGTLPNAHFLLRYLPEHIASYMPFFDVNSARNALSSSSAYSSLSAWFKESLSSLSEGIVRLFSTMTSAGQLATTRRSLHAFLDHEMSATGQLAWKDQIVMLSSTLEKCLQQRFSQIYELKLEMLVSVVPQSLQAALRATAESAEGNFKFEIVGHSADSTSLQYVHTQTSILRYFFSRPPFPSRRLLLSFRIARLSRCSIRLQRIRQTPSWSLRTRSARESQGEHLSYIDAFQNWKMQRSLSERILMAGIRHHFNTQNQLGK